MLKLSDGQCGLCTHFGHEHAKDTRIVQLRTKRSAPESLLETCDHPRHAALHLKVTPISGCDGYTPAQHN